MNASFLFAEHKSTKKMAIIPVDFSEDQVNTTKTEKKKEKISRFFVCKYAESVVQEHGTKYLTEIATEFALCLKDTHNNDSTIGKCDAVVLGPKQDVTVGAESALIAIEYKRWGERASPKRLIFAI